MSTTSISEMSHASSLTQLALLATSGATDLAAALDVARAEVAAPLDAHDLIRVRHVDGVHATNAIHRGALLVAPDGNLTFHEGSALARAPRPVAFMFPGLGDHYLGMGLELYRALPVFREHVDRCAALLQPEIGVDIRDVIYPDRTARAVASPSSPPAAERTNGLDFRRMVGRDRPAESPAARRLNETLHAQPALFVVEYALAKQWQVWGVNPEAMIGYSLGEYVAACLAGVLSLEDSLSLVARRARLIESLPPGAMLAVMLPEAEVVALIDAASPHLSLSAVNGPELCVVSGPPEEIARLEKRLRERGVTVRRVQSSHAFHSKMMEPIASEVTRLVQSFTRHAPRIPYVSNVTGAWITDAEATDPAYWAAHLCKPVRLAEGIRALSSPVLLEAGPGQTLSSLATQSGGSGRTVLASMRHTYDPEPDTAVLLRAVAHLWLHGAAVDWDCFPRAPLSLPAYGTVPEAVEDAPPPPRSPATKTEQDLAVIWQKVLGCEQVAADASFFKLGGNSLMATRLIDRVAKTFGVKLPLRRVYELATLDTIAAAIDALRGAGAGGRSAVAKTGAKPSAPAAPSATRATLEKPPFRLPNGLVIAHQNDAETRHFYEDIFVHRSYVKHGIRIPDGGCVLDVGGNVGLFTLFAHNEAKRARIFTFEPAPPLFAILTRNVRDHHIDATLFNYGLSNREREAPFTFYPHSAGMSSFFPDEAEERHNLKTIMDNQRMHGMSEVDQVAPYAEELLDVRFAATTFMAKLRRLSDVIREQRIERVDLMKVDVQKAELEVIEGIDDGDWAKFSQIVLEAHDVEGRVATLKTLFERRGFDVVAEQDELYVGTNIFNIYAIRRGR